MNALSDTDEFEPVSVIRLPYDWESDTDDRMMAFAIRGSKIVGGMLMNERNANAKEKSLPNSARHVQLLDAKTSC